MAEQDDSEITSSHRHTKIRTITSLVAQTVKRLSTMWETWVQSLGREDSLEKEMATHSSTLAWKIPWTEELGAGYCPWGRKESGTTERLHFHFHYRATIYENDLKTSRKDLPQLKI